MSFLRKTEIMQPYGTASSHKPRKCEIFRGILLIIYTLCPRITAEFIILHLDFSRKIY